MPRLLIALFVASLISPTAGAAQVVAAARAIRTVVVVEQPRGDSAVLTTVPPGVVIEVLGQRGDWYQVRLLGEAGATLRPAGWVHRDVVELLPAQGSQTAASLPYVPPSQLSAAPAAVPASEAASEPFLTPGTTELIVSGSLAGWNAGGDTSTAFNLASDVGFVVTSNLEVLISTAVAKVSGLDPFGSVGGGLAVNFTDHGPMIPFAGAVMGRGFGNADALGLGGLVDDPFFVNLSGGFRVMTPGGGGALIIRPFYERYFNSSELVPVVDANRFGVAIGASILF